MVLISIHPFALRRLFLVVVAMSGFSALCFADPVLMAHRYGPDRAQLADMRPRFFPHALSTVTPVRLSHPLGGRISHCDWPVETSHSNTSESLFLTASAAD
jgi:hypothetical protein